MKKRILAVVMALTMTIGLLPQTNYAQEANGVVQPTATTEATTGIATNAVTPENGIASDAGITYNTGLVKPEYVQIQATDEQIAACGTVESTGARAVDSYWDKFESNYYYNQLSSDERMLYDNLDALCYSYLTGTQDIVGITNYGTHYSDKAPFVNLDSDGIAKVYEIFKYSNPQYYFIGYRYGSIGSDWVIQIYDNFISGANRTTATTNFKNTINSMVTTIQAQGDKLSMEKKAHDLIDAAVTYDTNYSSLAGTSSFSSYEQSAYTQSCYSVFRNDISNKMTVCAGYSLSFELLCNAVGIDTIAVTSNSHAWNMVRQNGSWYYVDCTWDDNDKHSVSNPIVYQFFNRDKNAILANDQNSAHQEESFLTDYLPTYTHDSGATYTSSGTILDAQGTATTPTISIDSSGNMVIANGKTDEKFYYTLDGTNPSVSNTKCYAYSAPVRIAQSANVKAMAARDTYNDSSFTGAGINISTVTFNSNGGTTIVSRNVVAGSLLTKPTNPTKSGYSFMGWYKDPAYASVWNFASDTVNGNVTLYARWGKTYKIKYNLNGGTQNKLNPSKYTPITNTFTLQSPTRKGYTFGGWYKDQQLSKKITKVKIGTKGDLTLYAKWNKVNVVKGTIKSIKSQTGLKMAVTVAKVSGAAGYQISYSTKSNMKSAKSVKVTTTSATIQNLTKKKTYYVQIRPYKLDSTGNKVYGAWSDTKSVKIKK